MFIEVEWYNQEEDWGWDIITLSKTVFHIDIKVYYLITLMIWLILKTKKMVHRKIINEWFKFEVLITDKSFYF